MLAMWMWLVRLFFAVNILLFAFYLEAAPLKTTYQAKIFKPDGLPLESNNVSFRFTTLDPSASCVLYIEDFSAVNMSGSGGLISFSLGNGTRSYPASATTFASVFDNATISYSCQAPGIFSPVPTDNRKIVMQFNDGTGWQTLPAMAINAVPYAMYASNADDSHLLNGKADTAFVEKTSVPTCASDRILYFNGASFSCIAYTGNGAGGGVSTVTTSGSVLVNTGTASAPVLSVAVASMSTDGYLTSLDYQEFKTKLSASSSAITSTLGYAPVSSSAVATQITSALASQTLSGDVNGSFSATTVSQVGGKTASQVATSVDETLAATAQASASTLVKRDGSGGASFNSAYIYKPGTNFSVSLQTHASLAANYILTLPQDDGNSGQVLSTDGSGNLSWINPSTGSVVSVSGTSNEITSSGGSTPTLGLADVGTAGTYFKVITDSKGRVVSGAQLLLSDVTTALGYVPAASGSITSSQWVTSGTSIYYASGTVGVGTNSPSARLDVYNNGAGTSVVQVVKGNNTQSADLQQWQNGAGVVVAKISPAGNITGSDSTNGIAVTANATGGFGTAMYANATGANATALYATAASGNAGYFYSMSPVNTAPTVVIRQNGGSAANLLEFRDGASGVATTVVNSTGAIGVGTSNPVTKLDVSGGVRISMESATCTVSYAGTLRYNLGNVEYCNGSTWSAFGLSGSGMQSFNGSTSGTQSFAIGTAGNSPAFNTLSGVHTLNIPLASAAGSVTAGLISNADYLNFSNKVSSQWTTSGTTVNYLSGNVGIGTNNPDAALSIVTSSTANPGLKIYNSATGTGIGLDPYYPTVEFNRWHDGTNARAFGTGYTGVLNMDPANGDFRFLTGNNPGTNNIPTMADALIIKNSGNVGIGTTSPNAKLDLSMTTTDPVSVNPILRTYSTYNPTGTSTADHWAQHHTVNYTSAFNGNRIIGSHILSLNSSSGNLTEMIGAVGAADNTGTGAVSNSIGVYARARNSSTGSIYDAKGVFVVVPNSGGGTITNAYGMYIDTVTGTNNYAIYSADTTAESYFAGRIGMLGASAPITAIQIGSPFTGVANGWGASRTMGVMMGSNDTDNFYVGLENNGTNEKYATLIWGDDGNEPLKFQTNDSSGNVTERVRITATGFVGIGTSTPTQLLHIAGNATGSGNQTGAQIGDVGTGQGPLFLVHNNPTVAGNAYYNLGWKYGGGAGKPAWIDLVNGVKFFISNNTVGTAGTSITDTVSAKMTITTAGDVGIGTATPQAKLEVSGDARFGCRAGFWPVADGRICMETTLRSHTSINGMATGSITDNAIAICRGVGPGSRICTHTDFQQACGARAISGVPDVDPYGGVVGGVYGDHSSIVSGQVTLNPSAMPAGHMDDVYLTWNGSACSANNDGAGRHANETSTFYYRCCY